MINEWINPSMKRWNRLMHCKEIHSRRFTSSSYYGPSFPHAITPARAALTTRPPRLSARPPCCCFVKKNLRALINSLPSIATEEKQFKVIFCEGLEAASGARVNSFLDGNWRWCLTNRQCLFFTPFKVNEGLPSPRGGQGKRRRLVPLHASPMPPIWPLVWVQRLIKSYKHHSVKVSHVYFHPPSEATTI